MNLVCIVENKDTGKDVLENIQEGLTNHGVKFQVIPGTYQIENNLWVPKVQDDQVARCDSLLFYVANWNWDIVMYMRFANIWMTTPDRSKSLGFATYDARASLNKFIDSRKKLLELVDGLFAQQKTSSPLEQSQDSSVSSPTPKPTDTITNSTSQKLRELQNLKKDGLITEQEYQQKKKQLLERI